jgi:phosphoglycerol transferase MdoB-like AlkP superfamily enzyme
MPSLADFFSQIERSALATTIRDSTILTGGLSGLHLIGLTLLVGSALVSSAGLAGLIASDQPVAELTRATRRASVVGLVISVTTGLLLVSFRVGMSTASRAFQIKMLTLIAAALFHFIVYAPVARGQRSVVPKGLAGGIAFLLWFGVVLGGCAFILLE